MKNSIIYVCTVKEHLLYHCHVSLFCVFPMPQKFARLPIFFNFFFYKFHFKIKLLINTIYRNSNYRDEPYIIKSIVSERVAVCKRHIHLRWPKRRELSFKNTRSKKFNTVKYFAKRMLIIFSIWRQCIYTFVFDKISTN